MSEKIANLNIQREGRILYLGKDGNVYQAKPKKLIADCNVTRERGYLYFIDSDGDVARKQMNWSK